MRDWTGPLLAWSLRRNRESKRACLNGPVRLRDLPEARERGLRLLARLAMIPADQGTFDFSIGWPWKRAYLARRQAGAVSTQRPGSPPAFLSGLAISMTQPGPGGVSHG